MRTAAFTAMLVGALLGGTGAAPAETITDLARLDCDSGAITAHPDAMNFGAGGLRTVDHLWFQIGEVLPCQGTAVVDLLAALLEVRPDLHADDVSAESSSRRRFFSDGADDGGWPTALLDEIGRHRFDLEAVYPPQGWQARGAGQTGPGAGQLTATPEPAALAVVGLGGLALRRWRRT